MAHFDDETVGVVEFKSAWKKDRESNEMASQTRDIDTNEIGCQSRRKNNAEIQTDSIEKEAQLQDNLDDEKFLSFLRNVEPIMSQALFKSQQSTAFDGFSMSLDLDSKLCMSTHTLCHEEFGGKLAVTSLTWNSTGSVIAASYGRFDHEHWCTHKASLCTWNLNKRSVVANKPDTVIDLPSCLLSAAFHPVEPAIIAGGNFNGEVCVWDLSRETDTLIASSGKGDNAHTEPISKVLWYKPPEGKRGVYLILSVGYDGKMLFWNLDQDKGKLTLRNGHMLLASKMPRSVKVRTSKQNQEMGVTSLSFNQTDDSVFYVGAESGGIFKCSTSGHSSGIGDGGNDVPLNDPVTMSFTPHQGPVYSVQSSPFHRNLFLTCSSDTSLRIHSALQGAPLTTIEPASGYLFSSRWSPVRPLVLAVATQDGHALIYDLKKNQTTPSQTLEASPSKAAVYSVEFNSKQHQLLATGDALGVIRIWQLSDELATEAAMEREILNNMAESEQE